MEISRIYHPYNLWEDWKHGMWRTIGGEERKRLLKEAIEFTGNAQLYGHWMRMVIKQWPYACEHNLTNPGINHQAFIGHSACCLAIGCPEDITRIAWHSLTQQQRDEANIEADEAIAEWKQRYTDKLRGEQCQNIQLGLTF